MSLKERFQLNKLIRRAEGVRVYVTDNKGTNREIMGGNTNLKTGTILREIKKPGEYLGADVIANTTEGFISLRVQGNCDKTFGGSDVRSKSMFRKG